MDAGLSLCSCDWGLFVFIYVFVFYSSVQVRLGWLENLFLFKCPSPYRESSNLLVISIWYAIVSLLLPNVESIASCNVLTSTFNNSSLLLDVSNMFNFNISIIIDEFDRWTENEMMRCLMYESIMWLNTIYLLWFAF